MMTVAEVYNALDEMERCIPSHDESYHVVTAHNIPTFMRLVVRLLREAYALS